MYFKRKPLRLNYYGENSKHYLRTRKEAKRIVIIMLGISKQIFRTMCGCALEEKNVFYWKNFAWNLHERNTYYITVLDDMNIWDHTHTAKSHISSLSNQWFTNLRVMRGHRRRVLQYTDVNKTSLFKPHYPFVFFPSGSAGAWRSLGANRGSVSLASDS